MSLVFSAIAPHSPILIPQIGKDNLKQLELTKKSYIRLAHQLEISKAETIILISPHGQFLPSCFIMNICPEYDCNFEEFGDFSTKFTRLGNIGLAQKIRARMETRAPLHLISHKILDHGSSIPLFLLTQKLLKIKVIPLTSSDLSNQDHFNFGKLLSSEILFHKDKIAVIVSGDLSHRLTKNSPAGFSPKAKKFDQKIITFLQQNKSEDIIKINQEELINIGECGLKPILILLGILDKIKKRPIQLSYESPFGIGYLSLFYEL
jgi:MEMO1 family protein